MTGDIPFKHVKSDMRVVMALAVEHESPAELKGLEVPGALKVLLSKCWMQTPEERPTMASNAESIRLYLQTATPMPSLPYTTRRRRSQVSRSAVDHAVLEVALVCPLHAFQSA